MKKFKTPQEKKILSYQKDRRNTYGERGSHSRHAIAKRKDLIRRKYRHQAKQAFNDRNNQNLDLLEVAELTVNNLPKQNWYKFSDSPLGEVIEQKLDRRQRLGINLIQKKILK